MRARQLELGLRRRSRGRRRPNYGHAGVSHLTRPELKRRFPVHVTMRMRWNVWNLRSRRCFRELERAFWAGADRFGFRLVHFSVQGNHIHLLVEAEDRVALGRGMKGLGVRIARRLNRVMGRRGRVLGDRYHAHILRTPSEVRRARNYLVTNARRHYGLTAADPFTSVAPLLQPRTYLLCHHAALHLADIFSPGVSGVPDASGRSRGSRGAGSSHAAGGRSPPPRRSPVRPAN